ncbi:hypothetical protein CV_1316 [Chromobacterium violaceum ATCC 12472]|uniref:Uncharacterized protein n=1 Tax=Chromobacterium violaceum (strain ATCC 12472 / DSM 30191 / JCM 1249 / CCUG 213 / NBRC 12614 / NCIMB 9131 / NCTC 9757 / MK) TaxID=243365 RepID=Q7NYF8_CHRVO|nr:hypothetical protein CV_1316 [Chromobacterium violaceum ATCC 12472]
MQEDRAPRANWPFAGTFRFSQIGGAFPQGQQFDFKALPANRTLHFSGKGQNCQRCGGQTRALSMRRA